MIGPDRSGQYVIGDDAGRDLRIVVAEPRILKVFAITGLTDLFDIHPSLDLALSA